ncbi:mitochondrial matrix Mmp37-domain-containing protein [Catenaria anguillulae PL171]|uniref:Phosphatidate cytidylyltransferase, mitochondrial n=1 Tax=Catenaria anguillulae PL171 TaxID=765915 RepID=A0A1Y2HFD8_9FUNG|nr:mitochondrial matrix Mmp37-domain-containing protein [Catenaria anguillulae PL171]
MFRLHAHRSAIHLHIHGHGHGHSHSVGVGGLGLGCSCPSKHHPAPWPWRPLHTAQPLGVHPLSADPLPPASAPIVPTPGDDLATAAPIDLHSASPRARALAGLLASFKAPIRFAFAYGSAVFPQKGYSSAANPADRPMVDLIFGVTHPTHWHSINLAQHPHHYSSLRLLGSSAVANVQDMGAGVYYNPYVELDGVVVKYGVVSIARLASDLANWDSLYLAGRMHKPIQVLRHDSRISIAQWSNLTSAVKLALLLITANRPAGMTHVTPKELYTTLAGLSYRGDFRMAFKYLENPHKVHNLVATQMPYFDHVYRALIDQEFGHQLTWEPADPVGESAGASGGAADAHGRWIVDASERSRTQWLLELPRQFADWTRFEYARAANKPAPTATRLTHDEAAAVAMEMATSPYLEKCLNGALYRTIAWPALTQSVKGIATAGASRTVKYAGAKLSKGIKAAK